MDSRAYTKTKTRLVMIGELRKWFAVGIWLLPWQLWATVVARIPKQYGGRAGACQFVNFETPNDTANKSISCPLLEYHHVFHMFTFFLVQREENKLAFYICELMLDQEKGEHVSPITALLKTFGSDVQRLFHSLPQQVCIHLSGIGFRFEDKSQNMKITISCFIACYCNVEELLFSEDHNYIVINVICSRETLASRYIYSWSLCQCLLSLNGNFTLFARKIPWVVPGDYGP